MQVIINGEAQEVGSGRDALAVVGPADELILVHERADGARLQVAGSSAEGFVVDVSGGHTGDQTSASHAVPASAVATMFDRFAAHDTGWPGAIVWAGKTPVAEFSARKPIMGLISMIVGVVAAVLAVTAVRRSISLPWLCERDGREVDTVRFGGGGVAPTTSDRCVFANGDEVKTFDINAGLAWAEIGGSILLGIVVFYVVTRIAAKLLVR